MKYNDKSFDNNIDPDKKSRVLLSEDWYSYIHMVCAYALRGIVLFFDRERGSLVVLNGV